MFMIFTPYTFIYLVLYLSFLFTFFSSTNFYWCWVSMEILMLLFMGISYTLFYNSFSNLLVYFLIQAFSSFSILLFYLFYSPFFFTLSLILKLSLFPFHSWFITSVYSFPNFILFMVSTLHKLPIFFIMILYPLPIFYSLLWISMILTFLFSGFLMLSTNDFRLLLVFSSVGNNSWMLLSAFSGLFCFLLFVVVYFFSLFFLFAILGSLSKPYSFNFHSSSFSSLSYSFLFSSLSGLPPFPLFFSKMYVVYSLFVSSFVSSSILLLVIFSSSFMLMGYLSMLMKTFIHSYSSLTSFLFNLKWL